jgi:Icc-related predicted phosphoesterase
MSDTHRLLKDASGIPDGDVLIHAGDITSRGYYSDVKKFNKVMGELNHKHKIIIAGNHDFCFEENRRKAESRLSNCIYLHDSEVVIDGVKFYGSPWQPRFYDWAFNLDRGEPLREKWRRIPLSTDILITHGPPLNHGDRNQRGEPVGCKDLLERVEEVKPKLHIFGHIHEAYGVSRNDYTLFLNASICTFKYELVNKPLVYDYDKNNEELMDGEDRMKNIAP